MKRSFNPSEITSLNRAGFRVDVEALRNGGIELLLEEALAQVFGGLETGVMNSAACTEFTCNVYAPPPPPG
ncbi:MAG TPA: hypothetical protein VIJ36_16170 [Thermoanaerobaculia bacterium]|jgi:hypothetical protein